MKCVRSNLYVSSVPDMLPGPREGQHVVFVGVPYVIDRQGKKETKRPYPPFATHHTVPMIDDDAWRPHGSDAETAEALDVAAEDIANRVRANQCVVIVDQLSLTLGPLLAGLTLIRLDGLSPQAALDRLVETVDRRVLANPCMRLWLLERRCRDSFCETCQKVEETLRREDY